MSDGAVATWTGLDPSEVAVEKARTEAFPRTQFHVLEQPTPDMGKFDIILLQEMLCYVEDLDGLFNCLKEHLEAGGWIISSMFGHAGDVAIHRALHQHFEEFDAVQVVRETAPKHRWRIACYRTRA